MKILVYGAGNIGSLYAALLNESGQDVSILARGERLDEIRDHGIELEDDTTRKRIRSDVKVVERLDAGDAYDLVLVIVPRNHVAEVLPILKANGQTPSVMFFGNNAAGPEELTGALGRERVLLGFPGAAAVASDDRSTRYLILSSREQPTTIGEVDGVRSARVQAIAEALEAAGFPTTICQNMDAWLKTHAIEISPTANALYMAGGDPHRLANTRDALVLMLRAIRDGHRVLSAHAVPITPSIHRIFRWLPEPLLLLIAKRAVESDSTGLKIGHALGARDEMKVLGDELRALAADTSVATLALDRLYDYVDPSSEPLPEGSAQLTLKWGGVWALAAGVAIIVALVAACAG